MRPAQAASLSAARAKTPRAAWAAATRRGVGHRWAGPPPGRSQAARARSGTGGPHGEIVGPSALAAGAPRVGRAPVRLNPSASHRRSNGSGAKASEKRRRRAGGVASGRTLAPEPHIHRCPRDTSRTGGSRCAAMGGPLRRTWALVLLCAAAWVRTGAAAGASGMQKCASCKSLLGAVQRRALDGWAREQLLSACATRPEQQVRRAPGGVMHAAVSVRTSPGSRVLTPRCAPAAEGRVLGRSGGGGGADARGIRSEPARGPVQQGALLASRGGGQGRHLVLPCALTHRARCRRVCARRPSCRISRRWFSTPSPAARSSARHAKLPRATQPQLCRTPPRRTRCARLPAPSSRRCGRRRRAPHAPGLPERPMR